MTTRRKSKNVTYDAPECEGIPGRHRYCPRCQTWWPETVEFFVRKKNPGRRGTWDTWCRACSVEHTRTRRGSTKEYTTARQRASAGGA